MPPSTYAGLTRAELATLVPELLLIGQLIDRSGMAWCISAFGRDEMAQIAIEEWSGCSPIYTRRMQHALGYAPDVAGQGDVVTIFKGLQLDIGAPPQFMDFRYTVHDRWHGEFHLDHCGALMDVEPMGEDYVRSMCHDIEDPTFDATAVATNPRAQVRPVRRPPRASVDQKPHCRWSVVIDDAHPPVEPLAPYFEIERTAAASLELAPIEAGGEGASDYAGPLVSDLDFGSFSHSALVRIADEVCLQMHLLNLSYRLAVRARAETPEQAEEICRKQLVGIAGLAAERLHRALGLPATAAGALRVLELHPLLNPVAYVGSSTMAGELRVGPSPAREDGAWIAQCGPERRTALQAVVRAVDPSFDVDVRHLRTLSRASASESESKRSGTLSRASASESERKRSRTLSRASASESETKRSGPTANPAGGLPTHRGQATTEATPPDGGRDAEGWTLRVVVGEPAAEADEVAVTRFSTGSDFVFEPRRSLPLTVIG